MTEDKWDRLNAEIEHWRNVALWTSGLLLGFVIAGGLLAGYWWANR